MDTQVIFAGAGPGAPDLLTLRCVKALAAADLVIYAGPLVNPEVLQHCRPECRLIDSARIDLNEVIDLIKEAVSWKQRVVRLHTGDPSMYGAISEQMNRLDKLEIDYEKDFANVAIEVVPGLTAVNAAAASLGSPLTNGCALISLSDLLTPTATIIKNLEAVALSDLAVGLYNPAGKKRRELLSQAVAIFSQQRSGEIPTALVKHASCDNQEKWLGLLKNLPPGLKILPGR